MRIVRALGLDLVPNLLGLALFAVALALGSGPVFFAGCPPTCR